MHLLFTSLLLLLCTITQGFVPPGRPQWREASTRTPSPTRLYYKDERYTNDKVLPIPNDFKLFLTQCSIQSFMFLLKSMRDPETVFWLEDFTQPAIVQKRDAILGVAILEDSRMMEEEEDNEEENEDAETENAVHVLIAARNSDERAIDDGANDNHIEGPPVVLQRPTFGSEALHRSLLSARLELESKEKTKNIDTTFGSEALHRSLLQARLTMESKEKAPKYGSEAFQRSLLATRLEMEYRDKVFCDPDEDEECLTGIEEPQRISKLLQYHGLAALNTTIFPTWDVYFKKLLQEPTAHFIVESSVPHVPDYELDIDPASLCSRIVSVRDQISKEFVKDLQVISEMGRRSLESYWNILREKGNADNDDPDKPLAFERENLMFLEQSPDPSSSHGPSPLRKGNFDLLMLLTTQEACHRVLTDEARQSGPELVTNEYLKQFYLERVHYFRGPQNYGRADDFMEELLSRNPRMINVAEGVTSLIDPTRIAELILNKREEVALEWKALAEEAPMQHMEIQRLRLNRIMGVTEEENEQPFQ